MKVRVQEQIQRNDKEKLRYHYSKLKRKEDVAKWKKQKKIEWMKKLYGMTKDIFEEKKGIVYCII